jgi:hypothetical protein
MRRGRHLLFLRDPTEYVSPSLHLKKKADSIGQETEKKTRK